LYTCHAHNVYTPKANAEIAHRDIVVVGIRLRSGCWRGKKRRLIRNEKAIVDDDEKWLEITVIIGAFVANR
jgi:hypothetical protein